MQVKNIKFYHDLDFAMYRALPGMSYSGIKGGAVVTTDKMRLGTDVHQYLLEPSLYHHENRDIVKPIAEVIKAEIGDAFAYCKKEMSLSAEFHNNGNIFAYKGRIDMMLPKMIIDLKVSSTPLDKSIEFFGYDKQVNGYMLATSSPHGIIIRVCPKTRKVEKKIIKKDISFWEWMCELHGIPEAIF